MDRSAINVTPLIDVLLVLLIIFMVVAPLKPSSIKARIPSEPPTAAPAPVDPEVLVVRIDADGKLSLNQIPDVGTVADATPLITRLKVVFEERIANGAFDHERLDDPERPVGDAIARTVFIKAPRKLDYGSVTRVVDAVKIAGAYPISLQIDHLDS